MKWVLIIVIVLVGLIVAAVVTGLLLPKGHTAVRKLQLKQRPEAVWAVITDAQAAPSWRLNVVKVERLRDQNGHPVWRETYKDGETLPLEIEESVAPKRLVGRIADPKLPFGGTWTYEITPVADGCTITITERGDVSNPIFRLVSRFMNPAATIEEYLSYLAKKFGEEPRLTQ
jgi:uncharacterized protein YndB with AHSA1/START domain